MNGLHIYWKIIISKHTLHYGRGWMTQPVMPPIKRHFDRTKNLFSWRKLERIQTPLNLDVVQDHLRLLILNQKMSWVKFKENLIIMDKTMNGTRFLFAAGT
jgi:hypothetical protein